MDQKRVKGYFTPSSMVGKIIRQLAVVVPSANLNINWDYNTVNPVLGSPILEINTVRHRLSASLKIANKGNFGWNSTLFIAKEHNDYGKIEQYIYDYAWTKIQEHPYALGWVNRITLQRFSLGIDVTGIFKQSFLKPSSYYTLEKIENKYNSIALQNIFFAYKVPSSSHKALELYLTARNTNLNGKPNLSDSRRYYGVGFKFEINH